MQVLLISLIAVLMLPYPGSTPVSLPIAAGMTCGATIVLLLVMALCSRVLWRRLNRASDLRTVRQADWLLRISQWSGVVVVGGGALFFGWVEAVQDTVGNVLIVDEIIAASPALLILLASWWLFYPFEKRVREARLIRDFDEGRPVSAMPSRGKWVIQQVRTHLLLLLVPVLAIAIAADVGRQIAIEIWGEDATNLIGMSGVLFALPVVLLVPMLVVKLISTEPLASGELRASLEEACNRAGVKIRDILLWRTGGGMINGAVTGFISPLRWVMLSDGLLARLEHDEVLAVMAHELAHVRRRHMIWLALNVLAATLLFTAVLSPVVDCITEGLIAGDGTFEELSRDIEWLNAAATGAVLLLTLLYFGWVSRRFERQADAFAAVQLSGPGAIAVSRTGLGAMQRALEAVAVFNGVPTRQRSWRHGSIDVRIKNLERLEGCPTNRLPIDAIVGWLNIVAMVVMTLAMAYLLWTIKVDFTP